MKKKSVNLNTNQLNINIGDNCLNIFRLLSAIRVFCFHAIEHLDITVPNYITSIIGFFQGVPFFFIVSGFLIYFSIERSKNYKGYLKKRFFRIYPELWLCVILELLSIICLYDITNFGYFILFGLTQATIFQFWTPNILRNYGCGTPNGSLWTMCVLIQFYLIAYHLKKYLDKKRLFKSIIIVGISLLLSFIKFYFKDNLPEIIIKLYSQSILNYLYLFIIGMLIAKYSDKLLPILKKYYYIFVLLFAIVYFAQIDIKNNAYGIIIPTVYFVAVIGFSYRFPMLNIKSDLSYGIYLYHMVVINIFMTFNLINNKYYMFIAFAITIVLAKASQMISKSISQKKLNIREV